MTFQLIIVVRTQIQKLGYNRVISKACARAWLGIIN